MIRDANDRAVDAKRGAGNYVDADEMGEHGSVFADGAHEAKHIVAPGVEPRLKARPCNVLGAIDIFAMPSYWEGLPLSMVLAMGAGLPVVASRVAGIPEVVNDRVSGLLVDPGNSDQLARALEALVADPGLRKQLGDEARRFVTPRFGVDGYVRSIVSLYDRLLAAKGLA